MEAVNRNGERKQKSRKYKVVMMVTSIIIIYMLASVAMAFMEIPMQIEGMVGAMPILVSVFPVYLGANSYQKSCEIKNGKKEK